MNLTKNESERKIGEWAIRKTLRRARITYKLTKKKVKPKAPSESNLIINQKIMRIVNGAFYREYFIFWGYDETWGLTSKGSYKA